MIILLKTLTQETILLSYYLFEPPPSSIISLSLGRHPWNDTETILCFTYIPPHVRILSGVDGIHIVKEYLSNCGFSIMIEDLGWRKRLGGFNRNQMRGVFQGFRYEIMNYICGGKG